MCRHLKSCFESGSISLFPVKKTRRAKGRVKSEDSIEIFCDCRMPQLAGVDMIQFVMNGFTLICVYKYPPKLWSVLKRSGFVVDASILVS